MRNLPATQEPLMQPVEYQGQERVFHPIASIFPLLDEEGLVSLTEDIRVHGLSLPIVVDQHGTIVDGRNRYRALQRLGKADAPQHYITTTLDGPALVHYVVGLNLQRRHLTESQRGMVAARLANFERGANQHVGIPTPSQAHAAELLNVSRDTVIQARKVQREGAPAIAKAVDSGEMTIAAALPLTDLPKDKQPAALEDARQEAHGKKPTATQTRAAVSRTQVVATVKAQLAAGKPPREAVAHALQVHEVTLPTPALADAICEATNRQVTLPATDGVLHDGRTKAEEAAHAAETRRMFQLFNALEALATLTDLPALCADIPDYSAFRVEQYLETALDNLTQFARLWKEHCHESAFGPR